MTSQPQNFEILKSSQGFSILSVLIASALIVCALGGVGVSSVYLKRSMNANELATLAVAVESNLINAFHNKDNFPEAAPAVSHGSEQKTATPNLALRRGQLATLNLTATIGSSDINLAIPVQTSGTAPGFSQFLNWSLQPCDGFDGRSCILKYEVRLKKSLSCGPPACPSGKEIYSYAFAYQIDMDPNIAQMTSLGSVESFDTPIDPGYYRVEANLAKCDPGSDLFMTGLNRDTGEAFCVKKPVVTKCPDGRIPKGLRYTQHNNHPAIGLDCTERELRTFNCEPNYTLQWFNPQYADPENSKFGNTVPGGCVFASAHSATTPNPNGYPSSTTPYMKSVSGTFCPPYYEASSSSACQLNPNRSRNGDPNFGRGFCARKDYKGCARQTYTDSTVENPAWATWSATYGSCVPTPTKTCPPAPERLIISRTCSQIETSTYCSGSPDRDLGCAVKGGWDRGTPYAKGFYDTEPSAEAISSWTGRTYSCTFQDTSADKNCPDDIPDTDFNGKPWPRPKKNPKWYGGVQVKDVMCTYSKALNKGKNEAINAY